MTARMWGKGAGKGASGTIGADPREGRAATDAEMSRLVSNVDRFMAVYPEFMSDEVRAAVYASQNPALIADYNQTRGRAQTLKNTIDTVAGVWDEFKRGYRATTDVTSMYIGDAIDEIRSWFGYDPAPGIGGLGGLPAGVVSGAWALATATAAFFIYKSIQNILVQVAAFRIQRENPEMSTQQALAIASDSVRGSGIAGKLALPLIIIGAAGFFILRDKQRRK